jgi:hypothetical protein
VHPEIFFLFHILYRQVFRPPESGIFLQVHFFYANFCYQIQLGSGAILRSNRRGNTAQRQLALYSCPGMMVEEPTLAAPDPISPGKHARYRLSNAPSWHQEQVRNINSKSDSVDAG